VKRQQQGRETTTPRPHNNNNGRAVEEQQRCRNTAQAAAVSRPCIARAGGGVVENGVENGSSPKPPSHAESGPADNTPRGGGRSSSAEKLCEALCRTWEPAIGEAPRRRYTQHRARWLKEAQRLLGEYPHGCLEDALRYALTDRILGSRATTIPGLAEVAEQLIARAYIARQETPPERLAGAGGAALGWAQARSLLERAIHRHGREGQTAAREELTRRDARFEAFLREIRWSVLCEQPLRYADREYSALWTRLASTDHEHGEATRP
jgi:hypothetical protein